MSLETRQAMRLGAGDTSADDASSGEEEDAPAWHAVRTPEARQGSRCGSKSHQVRGKQHWTTRNHHGRGQVELELNAAATGRRRQTETSSHDVGNRVLTPEGRKPRV